MCRKSWPMIKAFNEYYVVGFSASLTSGHSVFRCLHHILYPICFSFLNAFSLKNILTLKRQGQDICYRSVIFIAEHDRCLSVSKALSLS
jgi:hypothetical protein